MDDYEFNGSRVECYERYFDHGYFVEEIQTEDGRRWYASTKIEDLDPEELTNLISLDLDGAL